eukprot:m.338150 g.338150  ORF g.338150 m.338150 type:complete len:1920 (-) comp16084_c0_seq5:3106-8865(-)
MAFVQRRCHRLLPSFLIAVFLLSRAHCLMQVGEWWLDLVADNAQFQAKLADIINTCHQLNAQLPMPKTTTHMAQLLSVIPSTSLTGMPLGITYNTTAKIFEYLDGVPFTNTHMDQYHLTKSDANLLCRSDERACFLALRPDGSLHISNAKWPSFTTFWCEQAPCNYTTEYRDADSICGPRSECDLTVQFASHPQKHDANTVCSDVTTCSDSQFEALPPTPTSDRICFDVSPPCSGQTYEAFPPTSTSDRQCKTVRSCSPLLKSSESTTISDTVCRQFSACGMTEYVDRSATTSTDTYCQGLELCDDPTTYRLKTNGNGKKATCIPIPPLCDSKTEYEYPIWIPWTERSCAQATPCIVGVEFELNPPVPGQDRLCRSVTTCNAEFEFEAQAPTATSDRVCLHVKDCVAPQYVVQQHTATSDRKCDVPWPVPVIMTVPSTTPLHPSDQLMPSVSRMFHFYASNLEESASINLSIQEGYENQGFPVSSHPSESHTFKVFRQPDANGEPPSATATVRQTSPFSATITIDLLSYHGVDQVTHVTFLVKVFPTNSILRCTQPDGHTIGDCKDVIAITFTISPLPPCAVGGQNILFNVVSSNGASKVAPPNNARFLEQASVLPFQPFVSWALMPSTCSTSQQNPVCLKYARLVGSSQQVVEIIPGHATSATCIVEKELYIQPSTMHFNSTGFQAISKTNSIIRVLTLLDSSLLTKENGVNHQILSAANMEGRAIALQLSPPNGTSFSIQALTPTIFHFHLELINVDPTDTLPSKDSLYNTYSTLISDAPVPASLSTVALKTSDGEQYVVSPSNMQAKASGNMKAIYLDFHLAFEQSIQLDGIIAMWAWNPADTTIPPHTSYALTSWSMISFQSESVWQTTSGDGSETSIEPQRFVTMFDTNPPVFRNCPVDGVEVDAPADKDEIAVSWDTIEAYDESPMTVTQTYHSGDLFNVFKSPHKVVYTATDEQGLSSQCVFSIYILIQGTAATVSSVVSPGDIQPGSLLVRGTSAVKQVVSADVWTAPTATPLELEMDAASIAKVQVSLTGVDGRAITLRAPSPNVARRISANLVFARVNDVDSSYVVDEETILGSTTMYSSVQPTVDIETEQNETRTVVFTERAESGLVLSGDGTVVDVFRIRGATDQLPVRTITQSALTVGLRYVIPLTLVSATHVYRLHSSSTVRVEYVSVHTGRQATVSPLVSTGLWKPKDTVPPAFVDCPGSTQIYLVSAGDVELSRGDGGAGGAGGAAASARVGTGSINASSVSTASVTADWAIPTATDDLISNVTVTQTQGVAPGSTLLVARAYTVVYEASDGINTATCTFEIRVVDASAPVLECPSRLRVPVAANGSTTSIASSLEKHVRVSDNHANLTFDDVLPYDAITAEYGIGTYTLDLFVYDVSGNNGTCSVGVDVVDIHAPEFVNCPFPISRTTPNATTLRNVAWTSLRASDNSGSVGEVTYEIRDATDVSWEEQPLGLGDNGWSRLKVQSQQNGTVSGVELSVGYYHVRATVRDGSLNAEECVFGIAVVSDSTPTLDSSKSVAIGSSAGGVMLVLIIVVVVLIVLRNRRKTKLDFESLLAELQELEAFAKRGEDGIVRPRELNRRYISTLDRLGKGNFGEVMKGLVKEPGRVEMIVAIKTLHRDTGVEGQIEMMQEAALMAQFEHPNIVGLVGVVTRSTPVLAVLEYCENGSLIDFLQKMTLRPAQRLQFARQCASGLAYLSDLKFVHRDIAARNVLVTSDIVCKISDFGMSRDMDDGDYYQSRGGALPIRWTAIEALEEKKFSTASDCWSFGILLYEIWVNGEKPYGCWNNHRVWTEVVAGYRLPSPPDCPECIYTVMRSCWEEHPSNRPHMKAILDVLRGLSVTTTGIVGNATLLLVNSTYDESRVTLSKLSYDEQDDSLPELAKSSTASMKRQESFLVRQNSFA